MMVGAVASAAMTHGATAASAPPASGHAEVVAQGVVAFGDGPWHWQLTTGMANPEVSAVDIAHPGFLLADGPGAVLVGTDDAPVARLAAGEALFMPGGEPATVRTLTEDSAATIGIALVTGSGDDEFVPGAAIRDVDLVRDILATNEAFVVHADVSAFVVVTRGAVAAGNELVTTDAGVVVSGDITLVNTAPEPAIVVAAVVGPALGSAPPPGGPTTDGLPAATDPPAPATSSAGTAPPTTATVVATTTTTTASPTSTSTSSSTSTSTTPTPATSAPVTLSTTTTPGLPPPNTDVPVPPVTFVPTPDQDGDGLSDAEEAAHGCYRFNRDSVGDALTDYQEVVVHGTRCDDKDTDDDGMVDYLEVKYGYDPTNPESHA